MLESVAKARLTLMTAATTEPTLSTSADGDIETLLDIFVSTAPSSALADDGVWSLNRAAAEGYRWKAGRIANRMNFSADGRRFDASDLFDHLMKMAEFYEGKAEEAGEPGEAGRAGAGAYVGGVSRSDKDVVASDTDRVRPAFVKRLHSGRAYGAELLELER